jgi:hypothetical protein
MSCPRAPIHQSHHLRFQATLKQKEFQAPIAFFARSHRRTRGRRGSSKVSFLELTSQLFRELDLGIASEPGCRFEAGILVGQLNLDHGGLRHAYRMPARKCSVKTDHGAPIRRMIRSTGSVPCQHSHQRGIEAGLRRSAWTTAASGPIPDGRGSRHAGSRRQPASSISARTARSHSGS